jgi:hypothetical protein
MTGIIEERFLEKNGIGLEVQIAENGPNFYKVWEPTSVAPHEQSFRERYFATLEDAVKFVDEIQIPGRRSKGWILLG